MGIDFTELLKRVSKEFPTQQAFAAALGMSTARLNRALNKSDYPFNVLNCLRLAKLSAESAPDILRAADKSEIADLIEALYGPAKALTGPERELIDLFARTEDPEDRAMVLALVRRVSKRHSRPASLSSSPQADVTPARARGGRAKSRGR